MTDSRPFRSGTLFALAAALCFGVTAPLVQRFGRGVGPFTTAALLYLGAVAASALGSNKEARPTGSKHIGRLVLAAMAGAFIAPACLAFGLQRAGGTAASLMLNLEAVFTVLLAWAVLGEHVGKRLLLAISLMLAGGLALVVGGLRGGTSWLGLLSVAVATLGWAIDNVVLRPLADLDPAWVVLRKAALGVLSSLVVAVALGEPWPAAGAAGLLVACGATGYGLSLRLYLLAQRRIGAGRTGSMFAIAPFVGAVVAWSMGQGALGAGTLLAAGLLGLGALVHATERHEHRHTHEPLEHEHTHRHDDGHHDHVHDPAVVGEHSHQHRHERVTHEHPHAPDVHHTHRHR